LKPFKNLGTALMLGLVVAIGVAAVAIPAHAGTFNVWIDDGASGTSADLASNGATVWEPRYEASGKYGSSYRLSYSGYSSSSYFYHWVYSASSTSQTYNLSAYIASPYMTNTSANYWMDSYYVGTLNQNAAPSGNNWVGTNTNYGVIDIKVSSYGSGRTGADAVNLWY